jgi:hypothetical protein
MISISTAVEECIIVSWLTTILNQSNFLYYPPTNPQSERPLLVGCTRSSVYLQLPSIYDPAYLSGIALVYGLDDRGFNSRRELGIFLFTTASRPAMEPNQPPIQ